MSSVSTLPMSQQMTSFYLERPKVTVASLYPLGVSYLRPFKSEPGGGYTTDYNIEACTDGKPTVKFIGAGAQHTHIGDRKWADVWEDALIIARDVVRNARAVPLSTGIMGPAVWVCEGSEPSKAEEARHLQQQINWVRARIVQADDWFLRGQRVQIGELDRVLAQWMKIDPRAHPWMKLQERLEVTPCRFCRTEIDVLAAVCPQCNRVANPQLLKELEGMDAALESEKQSLASDIGDMGTDAPNQLKDLLKGKANRKSDG